VTGWLTESESGSMKVTAADLRLKSVSTLRHAEGLSDSPAMLVAWLSQSLVGAVEALTQWVGPNPATHTLSTLQFELYSGAVSMVP